MRTIQSDRRTTDILLDTHRACTSQRSQTYLYAKTTVRKANKPPALFFIARPIHQMRRNLYALVLFMAQLVCHHRISGRRHRTPTAIFPFSRALITQLTYVLWNEKSGQISARQAQQRNFEHKTLENVFRFLGMSDSTRIQTEHK